MDTSYGELMDQFITEYIPDGKKALAMAELQLIVLKAQKSAMIEMRSSLSL